MKSVPSLFADYIHVDADYAELKYEFKVAVPDSEEEYIVFYEFRIRKDIDEASSSADYLNSETEKYKSVLFDEILSYSYKSNTRRIKLLPIIDTRTESVFLPASKYYTLVGKDKSVETNLLVAKKYAAETSRSFIFSRELLNQIRKNCKEDYHLFLFEKLFWFGA